MKSLDGFWGRVVKGDGCWQWMGTTKKSSSLTYGRYWWNGRRQPVHRVMWMITYGAIPDGMIICHRCDNPTCVNPIHLFIGTHRDNIRDAISKGRMPQLKKGKRGMRKVAISRGSEN